MAMSRNAAVVVFDGVAEWHVAIALASLRRYAGFRVLTIGFGHLPVLAESGLRVLPELTIGECSLDGVDALIVPGGELWERGPIATMTGFLHRASLMKTRIAAIGSGVVAVDPTNAITLRLADGREISLPARTTSLDHDGP